MGQKEMAIALLLMLVVPVHLQEGCEGNSCHPSLDDLMVGRAAQLSASSTCGANGPQNYCILGYLEDYQKCFTCDSRSPYDRYNNRYSHRVENVITTFEPEHKMKWWQSENGVHQVSIQLDLETVFQFSHLVLTFKSFRPAAMLVERSKDFGRTWKVFRYFSVDCANDFPDISEGPPETINDLICDTRYSGAEPSTDGEVVLKALDPNFSIDDPYDPIIQELITITNVRVNFTRLLTLGDDLLGRRRRNPQEKYYYALYEMVVRGSCFCNGHASQCMPIQDKRGDTFSQPGMVHGRCECEHNTMGNNCEMCQPFYNDAPWRPAGASDRHVCRRCNCNGHSERCHFDLQRYFATGQVSGGVCDDCRNNRMGPQCEQCNPGYYQDPQRSVDDPDACIPCNCDPAGSVDGGMCDPVSGQCVCKQNVEGERCDRCKLGFYGLNQDNPSGCQACMCNFLGTIPTSPCDQNTGQCICDEFAHGPECNQCVPGYWGLGNTVFKCRKCDCDMGGAFSTMCSSDSGQCQCRANMVGLSCSEPAPGYFLAAFNYYLYEAENAASLDSKCSSYQVKPTAPPYIPPTADENAIPHPDCYPRPEPSKEPPYQNRYDPFPHNTPVPTYEDPTLPPPTESVTLPNCVHYYTSRGYDVTFIDGKYVLVKRESRRKRRQGQRTISLHPGSAHQVILRAHTPGEPITWTGPGYVRVQDGAGLRFTISYILLSLNYHLVIRYEPQATDDWTATIRILPLESAENCPHDPSEKTLTLSSTGRVAILDPPICLSADVRYNVEITFEKQASPDPYCSSHILIDSMLLIPKMELLPNVCSDADQAQYQQNNCVELGAQAGEHTLPEICERLVASMSAHIHNGAIPCRCNLVGSLSSSCSKFGGQCDCKPNVFGRCCDICAPFSYGFGPNGCLPCDCDPYGSRDKYCDYRTGQCPCHNQVSGRRCDRCLNEYYGFPNCRRCECNGLSDDCDQITGACLNCRDHSFGHNCERCVEGYSGDPASRVPCERSECDTGYQGLSCDECAPGYYGNLLLPGARCRECFCNDNIDPNDGEVCDSVTGKCLHCLHNTYGPQCEKCKPGYYGNALLQDCEKCTCDQQGTEVSQCPLDSPCLCDQLTGQCPCRVGVGGIQCDRCEDEYWNLTGELGCQRCNCHPERSVSNLCNKVTGQCPCEPEYGGKECEKCAANHFGNPEIQCMPCDCNMQGSVYPGCDSDTGGCLCRPGVVGDLCDECAPGHDPIFPACEPCHFCYQLWEKNVTDILRAVEIMLSLVSKLGGKQQLTDLQLKERIEKINKKLMNLVSILSRNPDELASIENFLSQIKNITESIDANLIIIDPSKLLDTDIDNIHHEFKVLLDELQRKMKEVQKVDLKSLNDNLEKIRKLHTDFLKDGERVKEAKYKLDASNQIRQDSKQELTKCQKKPLDALEKKIKGLSVASLNEEICGAPGDVECKEAKCGGALCGKCGGPSCTGSLPVIQNAIDIANKTEAGVRDLLRNLTEAEIKIKEVRNMNKGVKNKAKVMINKITDSKDKFERDKNDTKALIQRVSEYLREDAMEPGDIDKVASAVLTIKLPSSQKEIRKMIEEIQNVMRNFTEFNEDLKDLEDKAKLAKDMKEKAEEILNRSKQIDVSEIQKALNDTAQLHGKIKQKLNETEDNQNVTAKLLGQSETKLKNSEVDLNTTKAKNLLKEIEGLKNKTETNRAQAVEAKTTADAAVINATDANKDLQVVEEQLKKLRNHTQDLNSDVNERLKNITVVAKNMAKDVENKIQQIEDLEKRIQDAIQLKIEKMEDLKKLMAEAEDLRNNVTRRVEYYSVCTT